MWQRSKQSCRPLAHVFVHVAVFSLFGLVKAEMLDVGLDSKMFFSCLCERFLCV